MRRYYGGRSGGSWGRYRSYSGGRRGGRGGSILFPILLLVGFWWLNADAVVKWSVATLLAVAGGVALWWYFGGKSSIKAPSDQPDYTYRTSTHLPVQEPVRSSFAVGSEGEEQVRYTLKWLDSRFRVAHDLRLKAVGYDSQQFDHLIVGPAGVFHLETKNFSGEIRIDPHGLWTQLTSRGRYIRIESPVFQVLRHRRILEEIIKGRAAIYDLIVLANKSTLIQGRENSPIPIVTLDMLLHEINGRRSERPLTAEEVDIIYADIEAARDLPARRSI